MHTANSINGQKISDVRDEMEVPDTDIINDLEPLVIRNTDEKLDVIKEEPFSVEYIAVEDFPFVNPECQLLETTTENSCLVESSSGDVTKREDILANYVRERGEVQIVLQRLCPRVKETDYNDTQSINSSKKRRGRPIKNITRKRISANSSPLLLRIKSEDTVVIKNEDVEKLETEPPKQDGRTKLTRSEKLKQNTCRCCHKYFPKLSKLKTHQAITNPDNFGCNFCKKRFEFKCGLRLHVEKYHNNLKKTWPCADCGKIFDSNFAHLRHKITHTENLPYKCSECIKRFRRKDHLKAHMQTMHPKAFEYVCYICGQAFKDRSKLANHMAEHTGVKRFKCPHCPKTLNSKMGIRRHTATHSEKTFRCERKRCSKAFFTQKDLNNHKIRHSRLRNFTCDYCDNQYKTTGDLLKHQNLTVSGCGKNLHFRCSFCIRTFKDELKMKEHEKTHAKLKRFKCPFKFCKKLFKNKDSLTVHKDLVHVIKEIPVNFTSRKHEPESRFKEGEPIVVLQRLQLGNIYKKPKWFKYLNGYGYFKKAIVNQTFYWRCIENATNIKCGATLKQNMITGDIAEGQNDHTHPPDPKMQLTAKVEPVTDVNEMESEDVKPTIIEATTKGFFLSKRKEKITHQCSYCKRIFGKKSTWRSHILLHTGEKPFACPLCDQRFRAVGTLISHKRVHTKEKPYKCADCNYRGVTGTSLKSHRLRHHTENLPKPYKCEFCPKAFAFKDILACHRRTHTKEKPYECHVCQKRFTQSGGLSIHKRLHTHKRPFKCSETECDYKSTNSGGLKRHAKVHHSTVTRLKCKDCNKKFKSMSILKYHCILSHFSTADQFCEED